jgi:hypothetical protein
MLPADAVKCPVCGANIGKSSGDASTRKNIASYSAFFLGIALIPLAIALLVGLICIITAK